MSTIIITQADTLDYMSLTTEEVQIQQMLISLESKMQDNYGNTALIQAVLQNQFEMVQILLPYELSIKTTGTDGGRSALDFAIDNNQSHIVRLITDHLVRAKEVLCMRQRNPKAIAHTTDLMKAIADDDLVDMSAYIDDIGVFCTDLFDGKGGTALHIAASMGISEYILSLFPELGIYGEHRYTALMAASENGCLECIDILLCEMTVQTRDGMTALMYAARDGYTDIVAVLACFEAGLC